MLSDQEKKWRKEESKALKRKERFLKKDSKMRASFTPKYNNLAKLRATIKGLSDSTTRNKLLELIHQELMYLLTNTPLQQNPINGVIKLIKETELDQKSQNEIIDDLINVNAYIWQEIENEAIEHKLKSLNDPKMLNAFMLEYQRLATLREKTKGLHDLTIKSKLLELTHQWLMYLLTNKTAQQDPIKAAVDLVDSFKSKELSQEFQNEIIDALLNVRAHIQQKKGKKDPGPIILSCQGKLIDCMRLSMSDSFDYTPHYLNQIQPVLRKNLEKIPDLDKITDVVIDNNWQKGEKWETECQNLHHGDKKIFKNAIRSVIASIIDSGNKSQDLLAKDIGTTDQTLLNALYSYLGSTKEYLLELSNIPKKGSSSKLFQKSKKSIQDTDPKSADAKDQIQQGPLKIGLF